MDKISILLLEDEQADADLISYHLKKENLSNQIVHVKNEKNFLKALEENPPSLILSDYHLPSYSALSALAALKEKNLNIPLIVLTGYLREEEAVECMQQGAIDYILKDRLARLPEAIRLAMQNKSLLVKQQEITDDLEQSKARFDTLYSSVPVALYRSTYDGKLISGNQAFIDLLGYSELTDIVNKNVQDFIYVDPADREKWKADLQENDILHGQFRARKSDGSILWLDDLAHIIRDENNEVMYLEGAFTDISEKRSLQIEQDTIARLNASFRFAENIEDIIDILVHNVLQILDAEGIIVATKKKADGLEIKHAGGLWDQAKGEIKLTSKSISHPLLALRLPHVENSWPDKKFEDWEMFGGVTAVVGVPLHFQEQFLGALWVGLNEPISDDLLSSLSLIADIISVEVNRTNLFLSNQRAVQENHALEEISEILYQTLALELIFKLVVDFIVDIVPNADRSIIHIYDEAEDSMYTVAVAMRNAEKKTFGIPDLKVLPDGRFDFWRLSEELKASYMRSRQGVAGIVVAQGSMINVHDTFLDDRFLHTENSTHIRSLLAVPIKKADRTIGSISLISHVTDAFSESDEFLAERFSSQVMIAIENARLYEAERVQRELAQAQAKIAVALNQTTELDVVLQLILEQIENVLPYSGANILLIEGDTVEIAGRRGYDEIEEQQAFFERAKDLSLETPIIKKIIETRLPVIIPDVRKSEDWVVSDEDEWVRSFIGIPLIIEDRIMGLLNVDSNIENFFSSTIAENLRAFSEDAASAIRNAKLYAELEKSLKKEQATRSRLIRTDKLAGMGRMVASVAHELNNPLQTIKNCLFLMEQTSLSEDNELLNLAMSEIERMTGIVNRLREVYRPMQESDLEEIPLSLLLEEVRLLLDMHFVRNKVSWNFSDEHPVEYYIKGMLGQLKQVFINLGLNGIEAMQPDGGELHVHFVPSPDNTEIGVVFRDTGPGIPEEKIMFIFDPFYTTKSTGMGLGLSICYDIAQNHNGRIVVENSPKGGAEFILWFPIEYTEDKVIASLGD